MPKILQIEPWIDESELTELRRVIESTYVVEHELTKEFEESLKRLTGATYVVATTNGTVALYCCLKALGVGPGDEVIVPNITFVATANAVILAGATPIFCEITPDTFCLDVAHAEKLINSRTRAIMPVHLYGQSADMEKISALAKNKKLFVVEDAAQGVGVKFNNKHVGTFGDLGVLSFYGNKTITCGEGGAILTDDQKLAEACYRLKNHGRIKKGVFIHEEIGFNFSFTEMQAAIGIAQLKKLPAVIEKKRRIHDRYVSELKDAQPDLKACVIDPRTSPVFWFTSFLSESADALASYLSDFEIQTRRFFYPLHLQPCYKGKYTSAENFSVSEKIYKQGISLPSAYSLSDADQFFVIQKIKEFYAHRH